MSMTKIKYSKQQGGAFRPNICPETCYAIRQSQGPDLSAYHTQEGKLVVMILDRAVRDLARPETQKHMLKPTPFKEMSRSAVVFFLNPYAISEVFNLSDICNILDLNLDSFLHHLYARIYVAKLSKDLPLVFH